MPYALAIWLNHSYFVLCLGERYSFLLAVAIRYHNSDHSSTLAVADYPESAPAPIQASTPKLESAKRESHTTPVRATSGLLFIQH